MPVAITTHPARPSSLPQQILEPTVPFGQIDEKGNLIIDQNWYLFLYNLGRQSLSVTGAPVPVGAVSPVSITEDTDTVPANAMNPSTLIWLDI